MIAALYVDAERGPYRAIPGCECWGIKFDATKYRGPWKVIAHPPCGPWGRLAHMCGPELAAQKHLGPVAVAQVRKWGGVLEHPASSGLWKACGMPAPGQLPDAFGGFSIAVEQWKWGHRAIKPTWLYMVGCNGLPPMPVPTGPRPDGSRAHGMLERLPSSQRHVTPPAFATWLRDLVEAPAVAI